MSRESRHKRLGPHGASNHSHHVGHSHGPRNYHTAFAIGVALNLAFVVMEAVFGFLGHSLALLSDAGHNLSDVFGLLLAWAASALAGSRPTERHTYGFRSSTILAALFNAILLLVAVGAIAWEAIHRFQSPAPVAGKTVIWVSAIGIAINTATALLFMSGRKGDLNIRGAFLHMAADAGVSLGVVLAGFAILWTGLEWIDPVTSLLVIAVILVGSWGLLRDSVNLALQAVPPGIDFSEVAACLGELPGVADVHDLHIWGMSTTETALTAHLVLGTAGDAEDLLRRATEALHENFDIGHATLQFEPPGYLCPQMPPETV